MPLKRQDVEQLLDHLEVLPINPSDHKSVVIAEKEPPAACGLGTDVAGPASSASDTDIHHTKPSAQAPRLSDLALRCCRVDHDDFVEACGGHGGESRSQ
jgi:hypothetical protein